MAAKISQNIGLKKLDLPALSIKNLTKIYNDSFKALDGISLDVRQGDFFALLGPNGAG